MTMFDEQVQDELIGRGFSRRQFGSIAALLGTGAVINATVARVGLAQSQAARGVAGAVRLGANECWTGPFPAGVQAGAAVIAQGNRYDPDDQRGQLIRTVAGVEGVPEERVQTWPGSGDPLVRSVVSFCSPQNGLVTMDPTFEAAWRAAAWLEAPVAKVPQVPGRGADVRAMLAAAPDAGLYYVCSPNNPTGTVTPVADIEWLAANKPAESVLLVDEAYLHFSEAPSAIGLAATRGDVVVMRTFSKLFGMAGMRLGLTFAAPELHARMYRYDGQQVTATLPMPAVACGNASYTMAAEIAARRAQMTATRERTIATLQGRGVVVHPGSEANMIMIDWQTRPAAEMQRALLEQHKVQIGRSWPIWPTVSRVTIGSPEEMDAFCAAVDQVIA
ncbi:MAG: pyridoxal phosphate-dependent aminotransferase [Porphyrobacter sp.]|nr:pyridoxal phosphate-dependent aminotransferase [Porphyrobacter sp.]